MPTSPVDEIPKQATRELRAKIKQVLTKRVHREIFRFLEEESKRRFNSQRDPRGHPWVRLAPSTVARKGHTLRLIDTHRLMDSLTGQTGDSIRRVESKSKSVVYVYGTEVEYSEYHQTGTDRIPQREHIGLSNRQVDDLIDFLQDQILKGFK